MKRVHKRQTLQKNSQAYYKACENLINLSQFKHTIFKVLPSVIGNDSFKIEIDDKGHHAVCLDKLEQLNIESLQ